MEALNTSSLPHDIEVNGIKYNINLEEIRSFLINCEEFMSADNESLEIMAQIISDFIIDRSNKDSTMAEIRPQLKFIREIGFLMKGMFKQV